MSELPHGTCECDSGVVRLGCCGGKGPVAYVVTRGGKDVRVCTRCDVSSDTNRRLLVTAQDPSDVYMEHDALGAFCLISDLAKESER